ncbi:uncharacterized protein MONBRDRAFT_28265 [Monosiga brevicollis MX1]|uniref:Uncharacterized protein n=1 Tax=Monosiga brevicollis TaxID=81824 RepID=A9V7N5_MONBE|nr:uncharacterized protein MONBRDRAFT_28265 [Monosiga brevicollis MX1]EDQ86335.1 predicted protein [Monosiga brevicollis MX1]|eukprot:XP_001748725.1 hypothetical protein [Monosiga brevicollis MX1]
MAAVLAATAAVGGREGVVLGVVGVEQHGASHRGLVRRPSAGAKPSVTTVPAPAPAPAPVSAPAPNPPAPAKSADVRPLTLTGSAPAPAPSPTTAPAPTKAPAQAPAPAANKTVVSPIHAKPVSAPSPEPAASAPPPNKAHSGGSEGFDPEDDITLAHTSAPANFFDSEPSTPLVSVARPPPESPTTRPSTSSSAPRTQSTTTPRHTQPAAPPVAQSDLPLSFRLGLNIDSCALGGLRSIQDKWQLFTDAAAMRQGRAMLAALLHLYNTTQFDVFCALLKNSVLAQDHFAAWLEGVGEWDTLLQLCRKCMHTNPKLRGTALRAYLRQHTGLARAEWLSTLLTADGPATASELFSESNQAHASTYSHLLRFQHQLDAKYNPTTSLVGMPMATTVFFVAMSAYDANATLCNSKAMREAGLVQQSASLLDPFIPISSGLDICACPLQKFGMSEVQHGHAALGGLAKSHNFQEVCKPRPRIWSRPPASSQMDGGHRGAV